ncbi:MAG: hypothetical protein ACLF0G_03775 [Candidatus Brocadiia bacterium]
MARPTALVSKLRELEAQIESAATGPRQLRELYREVWDVLTGGGRFDAARRCSRRAAALATWVEDHVHTARAEALGKALLEHTEFGASEAGTRRWWGVRPSEWAYLAELAAYLGEPLERGRPLRAWPAAWLGEVEEYHQEVEVLVDDPALQDMLIGALEAYSVPKGPGSRYTEVYGVCFGSVRTEEERGRGWGRHQLVRVVVARVALQLRARTAPTYSVRSRRSQEVHLEMAHELFPHLELVGDFHSHPYESLEALQRLRGWQYNDEDEEDNRAWVEELAGSGYRPRVGLILAIARAGRRGRVGRAPAPNVLRTRFGRCHCFLAVHRINRDGAYSTTDVSLRCPTLTGRGA